MRFDYFDRRAFLGALATLANRPNFANATPGTRFGAHTSEGKAMLTIYLDSFAAMVDKSKFPEGDPHSWMYHWNIHAVGGDRSKTSEIQRVYPKARACYELPVEANI